VHVANDDVDWMGEVVADTVLDLDDGHCHPDEYEQCPDRPTVRRRRLIGHVANSENRHVGGEQQQID